jgi:hypothetical protein
MRRVCSFAIFALEIFDLELDHINLLERSPHHYFLLYGDLDLDSPGVWLRPDECCINKF